MLSGPQDGQVLGVDEHLDAAGLAWLAADQACAFEGQHHLVDRWRADAEVALHVCLGRRPAVDTGIGVDEGEILPLLVGEAALRSEEHTSELQSLMRISYAVFCLQNKKAPTQLT